MKGIFGSVPRMSMSSGKNKRFEFWCRLGSVYPLQEVTFDVIKQFIQKPKLEREQFFATAEKEGDGE